MPLDWMTPREFSSPWVWKTRDDRYAVGTPLMGEYRAFHAPRQGMKPEQIGSAGSTDDAKEICEQHATRVRPRS